MKGHSQPGPAREVEYVPKQDLDRAQREIEQLRRQVERLSQEKERLREAIERLRKELEAALRANKRQAAPHSRGRLKGCPKRPGRKPGRDYGRQACRPIPARVDEQIEVPLPECCPACGGAVSYESTEAQFQEEIVRRTLVRRFDIAVGCCPKCQRRVQGRHPLIVTPRRWALGRCSWDRRRSPWPPSSTSRWACRWGTLNKCWGMASGSRLVAAVCIGPWRGWLAAPTYAELIAAARWAPVNSVDETGWKVGGRLRWLQVAVSAQVTVYAILPGRGYEQSRVILGVGYAGFLVHDGWRPYYRFRFVSHQSCLNHLLTRCRDMAQILSPAASAFPLKVRHLLEASLALRDRYEQGEVSKHGLRVATGWRPNWTGCWRGVAGIRPTDG